MTVPLETYEANGHAICVFCAYAPNSPIDADTAAKVPCTEQTECATCGGFVFGANHMLGRAPDWSRVGLAPNPNAPNRFIR